MTAQDWTIRARKRNEPRTHTKGEPWLPWHTRKAHRQAQDDADDLTRVYEEEVTRALTGFHTRGGKICDNPACGKILGATNGERWGERLVQPGVFARAGAAVMTEAEYRKARYILARSEALARAARARRQQKTVTS